MEIKAYIYKKTILTTGKSYIGKHNGNNPYYKGSGKDWKTDLKLYVKDRKLDLNEEVLEYVDDISKLNEREKFWLDYFDVENNPIFYNKSNLSHGVTFTSNITKLKQSGSSPYKKKVIQYDLDGEFIKVWEGMNIACKALNINGADMTNVCKGKQQSAKNFQWRYYELDFPIKIELLNKYFKSQELKDRISKSNLGKKREIVCWGKEIIQLDLQGNIIQTWGKIREACIQFGEDINKVESNLSGCLRKKQKTAYGYKWEYKN
tara:strand:- start:109 stop:894 length:786 start_codon:yes stop_codon:yes gene_type:complete